MAVDWTKIDKLLKMYEYGDRLVAVGAITPEERDNHLTDIRNKLRAELGLPPAPP